VVAESAATVWEDSVFVNKMVFPLAGVVPLLVHSVLTSILMSKTRLDQHKSLRVPSPQGL